MQELLTIILSLKKQLNSLPIELITMKFDRTGIILYTINYKKCLHFYDKILGLKKLFKNEKLSCFEFGGSYLMVELDDEPNANPTYSEKVKSCLRMNVSDVKAFVEKLKKHNIEVDHQFHEWGEVAKFYDPDGNLCAFKDSEMFEKQING